MGKVIVAATIENLLDLHEVRLGVRAADAVRRVEVADALVDTGATALSRPKTTGRSTRPGASAKPTGAHDRGNGHPPDVRDRSPFGPGPRVQL